MRQSSWACSELGSFYLSSAACCRDSSDEDFANARERQPQLASYPDVVMVLKRSDAKGLIVWQRQWKSTFRQQHVAAIRPTMTRCDYSLHGFREHFLPGRLASLSD